MKAGRDLAWVLALVVVFGGGLVAVASLKSPGFVPRTEDPTAKVTADGRPIVRPRTDPRYPVSQPDFPYFETRGFGGERTVILLLTVNERGYVIDEAVDQSSGYWQIDQPSLREAWNWRFVPGSVGGIPAAMKMKFAVTFKIAD